MELEDHLFFLCTQIVNRRDRALTEVLRPLQLLPTEWRILGTLQLKGPMGMLDLAQWTAYERTRLTKILHNMEARAWIERWTPEENRRAVLVRVAPKGAAIYRRAQPAVDRLNEDVLGAVPASEVERARLALQAMRTTLMAQGY